jgi:hypothetical protein
MLRGVGWLMTNYTAAEALNLLAGDTCTAVTTVFKVVRNHVTYNCLGL